ncbi:SAM-dependent methyltransferase [Paenibacillus koleovorans]|uniref:SAM-dependent methyltransferase n=1 Tax=Paenibacillus koleovorans TaxID=121608 RepID=UPI000FDBEA98|nr:SAM-dependent methyltransferase [Paenibacillus koleovorans]
MEAASSTSSFIATSNRGFSLYAQDEIRRLFPGAKCTELSRDEVFLVRLPIAREAAIARMTGLQEPIFVRHLQPVDFERNNIQSGEQADDTMQDALEALPRFRHGAKLALQLRKQEGLELSAELSELRQTAADRLNARDGIVSVARDSDLILSMFWTADSLYAGVSAPEHNLSDWSGGAIRFQREENQISRAKFKLLEAEQEFELHFEAYEFALDIGAAPGGWTSLLLERGMRVTAVDPGEMHPSLLHNPQLTILRKNAGDVSFPAGAFDLLVCDMSWSPRQMAKLLMPLLDSLRTGGTAIVTLKLMHGKPFQTVKDTSREFAAQLELVRAKQLFHNRDEVTLFLLKR